MSLNKLVIAATACGSAVAVQPHKHFMALTQTSAECSDHLYDGPSADDYKKMCADLDASCKSANDDLKAKHDALVAELKAECERQKRILAGKEDTHADEKADVKVEKVDVAQAKKDVSELAHCRPELVNAKQELAQEEATPNDSSEDIDNECKAKKLVMEKLACVERLEAAEDVLAKEKSEHKEESHEEDQAAAAVPPQEEKVRIACAAVADAGPVPKANCRNQEKKDGLLRQADQAIEDLLAEYLRQKKILEGKQDDHAAEQADVDQQEGVVAGEREDVKDAKEVVARDAHCPPELEKAQAELSKQQGIPNETPEDIDAECVAQKAVIEAQKCVDRLRKAEKVLAREEGQHSTEKAELSGEQREEDRAAAALPPQEKIVCELKAALDAARAARKALPCGSVSEESEPAPAPAPEPEKKSGTTRATAALATFAALLCAIVQA